MFGKRTSDVTTRRPPQKPDAAPPAPKAASPPKDPESVTAVSAQNGQKSKSHHSEDYYDVKTTVFNALIDTIDLTQLAKLDNTAALHRRRRTSSGPAPAWRQSSGSGRGTWWVP